MHHIAPRGGKKLRFDVGSLILQVKISFFLIVSFISLTHLETRPKQNRTKQKTTGIDKDEDKDDYCGDTAMMMMMM